MNLEHIQGEYVLVPADKAANNIVIVCKTYYIEVILKELTNTSDDQCTYRVATNTNIQDVVNRHVAYMRDRGIQVQSDLQQLPSLYWLPKLHKTPYGSRFIAASNKCTTKQLSSILTVCLSAVLLHYQE